MSLIFKSLPVTRILMPFSDSDSKPLHTKKNASIRVSTVALKYRLMLVKRPKSKNKENDTKLT